MDRGRQGSFGRAAGWMLGLSALLCWLPLAGPLIAGFAGGRKAARPLTALAASILPAALWAGAFYALAKAGIRIGSDEIALTELWVVGAVSAAMLVGGALLGVDGTKLLGLVIALAAVGFLVLRPQSREFVSAVRTAIEVAKQQEAQQPEKEKTCAENLKQLYSAIQLYSDSWDGYLPPADSWMTAIKDNVPKDEWLRCPAVHEGYGYAMNPDMGSKKLEAAPDREKTPLLFDSIRVQENAAAGLETLPSPGRHAGKNHVLFADGHVEQK